MLDNKTPLPICTQSAALHRPNLPFLLFICISSALGGVGVGISATVCPLYISEISPTHLRGRLVPAFQFAIILVTQILMVWKWMPETAGRSLEEIERDYL